MSECKIMGTCVTADGTQYGGARVVYFCETHGVPMHLHYSNEFPAEHGPVRCGVGKVEDAVEKGLQTIAAATERAARSAGEAPVQA